MKEQKESRSKLRKKVGSKMKVRKKQKTKNRRKVNGRK